MIDEHDHVIGQATRGQCHADKTLIHRSVSIAIFNNKGEIFLQKRSLTKDTDPGNWAISSSGHLTSGQNYDQAAIRELKEELGITTPITLITKHITHLPHETEMNAVYRGNHNGPFTLNPQEIETGRFFSKRELNQKVKTGIIHLGEQDILNLRQVLKLLN